MIADLSDISAVAKYLHRIGATARGMRTAHVQEREGRYSREIAVIHLDKDGQITVSSHSGEDVAPYLPDDTERHEIAIEAKAARWPKHKLCATIRNAPDAIKQTNPEDLFEFRDDENNIVMLQVRRDRDDGTKSYVPYTYWDDDQWRMAEPEALPLWGIDQLKHFPTVFIHEGAKAARAMRCMVEAATPEAKERLSTHPWGETLRHAAHVGWIGGALSPHRTDWSILHKFGVGHVIIVADNDDPGHAAVPKIAKALRHYPIRVQALRFDERWPVGFDLADPFPERMFQ